MHDQLREPNVSQNWKKKEKPILDKRLQTDTVGGVLPP
jgi:hypothetical protein